MFVTVAICTWNRANLLDRTLAEMHALVIPGAVDWELLVVNNNCTDHTDEVIARHVERLPIRRLFEPNPGHSNARNRALDEANGDLIICTDDDVMVDVDWLASYVSAAERWPEASYFGGKISPWFEGQPPSWVLTNLRLLEGLLVIRDLSPEERPFESLEQPFGANMAFRRAVLENRRFDPVLGRHGDDGIIGDETALFNELRVSGAHGIWVPAAHVRHYSPKSRLTRGYLWSYFRGLGRTEVRAEGLPGDAEATTLGGAPRWLYRKLASEYLGYLKVMIARDHCWVVPYTRVARIAGMIFESRESTKSAGERVTTHAGSRTEV